VFAFVGAEFRAAVESVPADCPSLKQVIEMDTVRTAPGTASCEPVLRTMNDADLVAVQMYTSGTTGVPRGAMLSHWNLRSMVASWLIEVPLRPGSARFLQVTPLFHVGGVLMLLSNLAAGATLVLHPEFVPGAAVAALSQQAITHALFVPAMIRWLLQEPGVRERKYPQLQMIIYGAAPMPLTLLEEVLRVFGCSFLQGYGLTETSGVLTVLRPDDHRWPADQPPPAWLASAGREVLCCEVRVVHPDGSPVLPGEVGEIIARGENIMAGYFGMREATAATLVNGWLHTGDLGRVDEAGFIYIVDRLKDMIIVGGENVYPQEIEVVLGTHTDVVDSAVIGIPHAVWGEEILAIVVLRSGATVTERALIQHCRAHLARFKCPTKVEFRSEIPRNAAGKSLKRELRAPYWSKQSRQL
jgi:acyl-CoA synthetase (AMP-forming)/AMP-acid ligase II